MIQVFKTDEDYKKWLNGQTLPSGIVVYVSDDETMYFSTNNIKGELKTYKCEKEEPIQHPPLIYSAKSAGSTITVNGETVTLEQGDNITLDYPNEITSVIATNNTELTYLQIPNTVVSINDNAFGDCVALTSITLPDSLTSIGVGAFQTCIGLTSINIPSGVTSISMETFNGCSALASVTLPEGLTNIGSSTFMDCTSLTSITIPSTVTMIDFEAFNYCEALTDFNFNGTMAQWGAITLGTDWNLNAAFTVVHCTDGDVSLEELIQHEYVDLGLPSGLKWAKCNVGAATETDYGDYFQWGSTKANTPDECTWANAPFNNGSSSYDSTYFDSVKDTVCPNGILAKEYDAVTQIMGGDWRMPTKAEFDELLSGTTNEWITNYNGTGINGRKFTSNINGNSIFIPAAGYCGNGSVSYVGSGGNVWSSSLSASYPDYAWYLGFNSGNCSLYGSSRFNGWSVRGVRK